MPWGVRPAAGRYEEPFCGQRGTRRQMHAHAGGVWLDALDTCRGDDANPLDLEPALEEIACLRLLDGKNTVARFDDQDLHPKPGECLRHLNPSRSTADDDDARRQPLGLNRLSVGPVGNRLQARDGRDGWCRAGRNHNGFARGQPGCHRRLLQGDPSAAPHPETDGHRWLRSPGLPSCRRGRESCRRRGHEPYGSRRATRRARRRAAWPAQLRSTSAERSSVLLGL